MIRKACTIREYRLRGYRAVMLENSRLAVIVLPEKGAEIHAIVYKPKDLDVLWKSPWGLHRRNSTLVAYGNSESAWMDSYAGGWQGIFPNGGDACIYKQAALGFHGEASTASWDYTVSQSGISARIEMKIKLVRSPFTLRKEVSIEAGSLDVQVKEYIVNESDHASHAMWGQHPAFATKLLDGACLKTTAQTYESHPMEVPVTGPVPAGTVNHWPLMKDKDGRLVDLSILPSGAQRAGEFGYLSNFEQGQYLIKNDVLGLSVELCWDHKLFPYVWYWLEWGNSLEYPWYGRCQVAAFEPFSSMPGLGLKRAIERGTAILFNPRQRLSTELCLCLYPVMR